MANITMTEQEFETLISKAVQAGNEKSSDNNSIRKVFRTYSFAYVGAGIFGMGLGLAMVSNLNNNVPLTVVGIIAAIVGIILFFKD